MLKNYLKTAYRNLLKTKVFSLLNIFGLAFGITACVLILHYVNFEKSYDRFHKDGERIYRLRYDRFDSEGGAVRFASCCPPAAPLIREGYPEVEKIGRMLHVQAGVSTLLDGREIKFLEERIFFAEPDVFDILKFHFIEGDPLIELAEPNKAFVSSSVARKYFGSQDPIGKVLSIDKKTDYRIVGLFEDVPSNSHLKFDILIPWKNLENQYGPQYYEEWGHTGSYTYLRVKPQTDIAAFENKLDDLVTSQCPWLKEYKMTIDLVMQPLYDIHLTSHYLQEYEVNGNRDNVNFLFIIAFFIILMAWVNYINLSTSRAITRAQETGLRKVIGASRAQLIIQFFLETVLINFFAILCTMLLIKLLTPLFSQISGIPLTVGMWSRAWFWEAIAGFFLAGVFLSGLYPVLVLSSFKPSRVLKGRPGISQRGINLRKVLVIFQFVISLALLSGTLTVYKQLSFMRRQDPGFSMDQTLVIKAPRVRDELFSEKMVTFKETLLNNPNIAEFCTVTEVPGRQIYWDNGAIRRAGEDISKGKNYMIVGVDYDFIDVLDIEMVCGRNFSKQYSTDPKALMLNETGVKWMGFDSPESALNQQVDYWGEIYTIIGVVKDYHQQSPKQAFEPQIFRLMPEGRDIRGHFVAVLNAQNIKESVQQINRQYEQFFPGNPFDYFFLDDYFNQQYKFDELFGRIFSLFAGLAIIITALGIFGLASFSAVQRTKEIGIRKVLGADVKRILLLLIQDFVFLLALAGLFVLPVLIFGINRWLESFAKRMDLDAFIFVVPMIIVLCVTLFTVSYQTIKSATANPVDSIRYE
ncbi:ABC transporter permease [candidate division KSB1 bacterium]|nr:ABC transporter permease [candidate division KSB1 bacterium]